MEMLDWCMSGAAQYEGRVEICLYNGMWKTVCDDYWSSSDAKLYVHNFTTLQKVMQYNVVIATFLLIFAYHN